VVWGAGDGQTSSATSPGRPLAQHGRDRGHWRPQAGGGRSCGRAKIACSSLSMQPSSGWWHYDPLRHVFSGDARANEIFDVAKDRMVAGRRGSGKKAGGTRTTWKGFTAAFEAAVDPADPKPLAIEYRVSAERDGEVRWGGRVTGLRISRAPGVSHRAVSIIGTVQDITERKEREEKEHLLMREVNHRAKNMLSVVDAIAHQTVTRKP